MNDQCEKNTWSKIGAWLGNITNLAALFAIVIIVINITISKNANSLVMLVAFGTLILMVFLKYADVSRFKETIPSGEAVPPMGLAKGSIRALLAFGILLGFGLYIYYVISRKDVIIDDKIFTALLTILSAVTGFYFGSRGSSVPLPDRPEVTKSEGTVVSQAGNKLPPPNIKSILPAKVSSQEKACILRLTGTGFQSGATVNLNKGSVKISEKENRESMILDNKITCFLDLSNGEVGKWDVVVTNPDNQTFTLQKEFVIV